MFNAISYWINSTSEVVNKQLPTIQKNELLAEILTNTFEKGRFLNLNVLIPFNSHLNQLIIFKLCFNNSITDNYFLLNHRKT